MKKLLPLLSLFCVLFTAVALAPAAEKAKKAASHALRVSTDRNDAIYPRGQTVTFNVRLEYQGKPVERGEVTWTLSKDGVEPRRTGRAPLANGQATITGMLNEPGFLLCNVTYEGGGEKVTASAGAGIAPTEIRPSLPVPSDFADFWDGKKKLLATVPMNPRLTPVKSPADGIETFDLHADSVGKPVSAYYARPKGAQPRSLPAILTVHGAGVRSSNLSAAVGWAREGALAVDMNAHGLPNGREDAFYAALAAGELKDYRRAGRESRETIYFLGMLLRLVRAIDFLTAQPEWDGRTVVVSGASQGGLQAIAAAGLDARVSFFAAGVPAGCDHTGAVASRIAGWPKFIETKERPGADVVAAVRYYDCVNFATRAKAPGFFTVGFIDATCPPTSVYAAYNALPTKKEIFNDITAGHTTTPAAGAAMRAAVKAHFAAMRR